MSKGSIAVACSRPLAAAALSGVLLSGTICSSLASDRAALILGTATYGGTTYPTAQADQKLMSTVLREMNFDVLMVENVTTTNLATLPDVMRKHLGNASLKFVYYAGVGLPARRDILLPAADASATKLASLSVADIVGMVQKASDGKSIVVIDAAPLVQPDGRAISLGTLGNPQPDVLLAYSSVADTKPTGNDTGLYATTLANALSTPGIGVQQVFRNVRRSVREATRGEQLPIVEGGLAVEAALRSPPTEPETPPVPVTAPQTAAIPQADIVALDRMMWKFVRDSADVADFDVFARIFPKSAFTERALARRLRIASASEPGVGTLSQIYGTPTPAVAAPTNPPEVVFGTTGDRAPPAALRVWPGTLPATAGGLGADVTRCDLLAADPDDPMRLTPGVNWALVDVRAAIRACIEAVAAQPTNRRLQFELGRVLDISGNYPSADAYYLKAQEQSYSAAIANRAYMRMAGRGTAVDFKEAIPLLKAAALLGNLRSRTDLGVSYLRGAGVETSTDEALLWLRLAGSQGWPNAIDVLAGLYAEGKGVAKDPAQAAELFRAAAAVGNTNAMANLGLALLNGTGVARNVADGIAWLERSSTAGNPFAPFHLAQLYLAGNGVPKNVAKAVTLLNLSSNRGFGQARFVLAGLQERGDGVKQDLSEAAFNYALTNQLTFETPVSADILDQAKAKFDQVKTRLPANQRELLDKRIKDWIQLNG